MTTLFQRIINRELPARIEYEDDTCIVIHDINPQAPIHLLIIPKTPIPRLAEAQTDADFEVLGHLLRTVHVVAHKLKIVDGFRVVMNNGLAAGETVPHLHIHLLAGRPMKWPPG